MISSYINSNDIRYYESCFSGQLVNLAEERKDISYVNKFLLLELIFVTAISILLMWLLSAQNSFCNSRAWLSSLAPFVLICGAIIPTVLRKKELRQIGFQIGNLKVLLKTLPATCLIVFSALLLGILILNHYKISLPLRPIIPKNSLLTWILYQFMYVAIPEEIFFRGYLQSNVMTLFIQSEKKHELLFKWISIVICAAVFASAHFIILENVLSLITFFPGLIMGWLFFKTRSLLAPIIFHGLANIFYGIIAAGLL